MKTIIPLILTLTALSGLSASTLDEARDHLDKNHLRQARSLLEKHCPAVPSADCWNMLGVVRMTQGGYSSAQGAFMKALNLEKRPVILSNLALSQMRQGRRRAAHRSHLAAIEAGPNHPVVKINFAIFLYRTNRPERARLYFLSLIRADKDDFLARLYLAKIQYNRKDYYKSLRELSFGIRSNPSYFELYYQRALTRYRLRDYGGALSDLRMADRLQPLNGRTRALRQIIKRKGYR